MGRQCTHWAFPRDTSLLSGPPVFVHQGRAVLEEAAQVGPAVLVEAPEVAAVSVLAVQGAGLGRLLLKILAHLDTLATTLVSAVVWKNKLAKF